MTAWAMTCAAGRLMTPRAEVWGNDVGGSPVDRCGTLRSGALRCDLAAGGGEGDDGPGLDDQRPHPRRGGILVVTRAQSGRAGGVNGDHRRDDGGNGDGFRSGNPSAPTQRNGHDRYGNGSIPVTYS